MIWFLLLYVLPLIISSIVGYKHSKESGETRENYLVGVLFMLIPGINLLFVVISLFQLIFESKIIKNIKQYLKQPL